MDDSLVTDAAVICWKQLHALIEGGASDEAIDEAMRQYVMACREQMQQKGCGGSVGKTTGTAAR